jgi:hypothetical protein
VRAVDIIVRVIEKDMGIIRIETILTFYRGFFAVPSNSLEYFEPLGGFFLMERW